MGNYRLALEEILAAEQARLPRGLEGDVRWLGWVDLEEEQDPSTFDPEADWASCVETEGVWMIGLHPDLQSAPAYVLHYLVFHELLHLWIPPRGGDDHPIEFRIAEHLHPHYRRASAWLYNKYTGAKRSGGV